MSAALRLGLFGFSLIAVCYGLARFAFGLFLPQIDADMPLGPTLSGVISGGAFLAYSLAITLAAYLTERLGPRAVAISAALAAAAGMAGIAAAPNAVFLAAAVMVAGASTGLASPPMAAAVAASVRRDRQEATNTAINAGTSAGVALSGPIALLAGGEWRTAFYGFALAALALAVAAWRTVPPTRNAQSAMPAILPPMTDEIGRLVAAAFLMGAASTAVWSFGGQLASLRLGWGPGGVGALWTAIGVAGIAGAFAGALVTRLGIERVHRIFLALMALGILAVGGSFSAAATTLAGGVLFGASYVMLTGVYLVWGVAALPDRPATGLMVGFLTIAIGQTVGAPVFGLLLGRIGHDEVVLAFACLGLLAGLLKAQRAAAQPR